MSGELNALFNVNLTGLLARQSALDAAGDNLANLQTLAFKEKRITFQNALDMQPTGVERGVELGSAVPDFTQGLVEPTGVTWDLAIDGPGFFVLRSPTGQTGYTRLGAFRPDAQGHLVNEQGWFLDAPVTVPVDSESATIDAQGTVTAIRNGIPGVVGRLRLARFVNPESLVDTGNGVFVPSPASSAPIVANPGQNGTGQIVAGALEMSNADMTQQLLNVLEAQRGYGLTTRALQISDQMYSMTNQLLG